MNLHDKGVIDSGCSRHMTRNMFYLTDYKQIDEGYVAFRGNPKGGKITEKVPLNCKAFRVFNSRTRIVKENLHIRFSENTPNVVGSGPDWLFDIDALTRIMNYEPIIEGTQSNDYAGKKVNDNPGQARKETKPVKDYILLLLWTTDPPFSQDPKSSHDDGFKPLSDDGKKVVEDLSKGNECTDQEKEDNVNNTNNVNSTNNINIVSSTINAAGTNNDNELPFDPNVPTLEDVGTFDFLNEDEDDGEMADMNNLDTLIQVSPTLSTRIHKDHLLDQVIGDLHLATQTRHVSKNLEEHGFVSTIQQRANHKDLQNCLFACFLSQEEPKKVIHALKDPSWIKAMQKELLQFKLQEMDVKINFLYRKIEEEVYVCQPPRFEDPNFLDRVYKVEKALYGLHQAPRAWYETLATYMLDNGFQRGKLDKTLFNKRHKDEFYGELTLFLGLQVKQKNDGIIISQDKYVAEILKKFGFIKVKNASTPMETQKPLLKDEDREEVDVHIYRYQVNPKVSHLHAMKRIYRVDGKEIIITESSVRRDLRLLNKDEHVVNEVVHKERGDRLVKAVTTASSLEAEQDNGNIDKTQSKATPNEASSPGTTSGGGLRCQEAIGDTIAQTRFENVSKLSNDSLLARGNTLQSDEDSLKLNELMEVCTNLQSRVLASEKTKTTQALEITSLKRKVKKLEKKQMLRTHKLKRLYKVGLTARVDSSKDELNLGEDASKQERIEAIDTDEDITLVNDQDDAEMFDVSVAGKINAASIATTNSVAVTITTKEVTLAKALVELKASKPKKSHDKGKGIVVEEPVKPKKKEQIRLNKEAALKLQAELQAEFEEEQRLARECDQKEQEANIALIEEWDDIQSKIDVDYQLAQRLQAEEQQELTGKKLKDLKNKSFDSIQKMFDRAFKRVNTFVDFRIELVEGSSKRAGEELKQGSSKKQKVDDNKEIAELKELMKIILDEEEVAIDVIPLAVKSPKIVD
uniref:Reverse transcriptase Ty1/copia-type domain-containing protein n=1 Tax=Tanacetum cinerariifolium TaxID=118510 RepID=A0A699HJT1_TANCI|nr:hypothetical protein [Tanacetum cinerariifolium]